MKSSYVFRRWPQGISMWCLSADIAEEKQAPPIVLQLRGVARALTQDIEVEQLTQGGRIRADGQDMDLGP
eukprot:9148776-Lingulodinium_polyedra.AAC.1